MQAVIKRLHSPDVEDLKTFAPVGGFAFLLQIIIAPENSEGEESFDVMVSTPDWFQSHMTEDIQWGRHYIFMRRYDYKKLEQFLNNFISSISANSWDEIGQQVGRMGKWEFEDYKPKR